MQVLQTIQQIKRVEWKMSNLYKYMGDIDVCIEFEMLKVKVPIIFLGTVGFSPLGRDVIYFSDRYAFQR